MCALSYFQVIKQTDKHLLDASFKTKNPANFYTVLWFKAKYDHPEDLLNFIKKYKNLWQSDSFLRRQVTAVLSRLLITNSKDVESLLYTQISSGITNTVSLANQIQLFAGVNSIDAKLRFYLFPKNIQSPYPLPKFLVLCSVLNSESIRVNQKIRESVLENVKDPYYRKWLDAQYNVN